VGTLIALTFVLTLEDKERFQKSRDVGCYVGLRPKRSEIGARQPQLGISQGRRYVFAQAAGAGRAWDPQAARAGHESEALGLKLAEARRQEREEAGDRSGGAQAGDFCCIGCG